MGWRFSDESVAPPLPVGHALRAHVAWDGARKRHRWRFGAALQSSLPKGAFTALSADQRKIVAAEVQAAVQHISAAPPDETVFGMIYDTSNKALPDARRLADGNTELTTAREYVSKARGEGVKSNVALTLMDGASRICARVHDLAPNHLMCSLIAADAHFTAARLSEEAARAQVVPGVDAWAEAYCRTISYVSALERATLDQTSPDIQLTEAMMPGLRDQNLIGDLQQVAFDAGLGGIADGDRLRWLLVVPTMPRMRALAEILQSEVNWVRMTAVDANHRNFFQLAPGSIVKLRTLTEQLLAAWRTYGVPGLPTLAKTPLQLVVKAAELVSHPVHPLAFRVEACKLYAAVPCKASVAALELLAADAALRDVASASLAAVKAARQDVYGAISDF